MSAVVESHLQLLLALALQTAADINRAATRMKWPSRPSIVRGSWLSLASAPLLAIRPSLKRLVWQTVKLIGELIVAVRPALMLARF